MAVLAHWKVWCNTENAWKDIYLNKGDPTPNYCPVDPSGHTADPAKTYLAEIANPISGRFDSEGRQIVNPSLRLPPDPTVSGATIVSHDFGDRTTWYQRAVQVGGEVLSPDVSETVFSAANDWWVDIRSPRLTYDTDRVYEKDGSTSDHSKWDVDIRVDGVAVATGFTINYQTGVLTFDSPQTGKTVTATYWHTSGVVKPSLWVLNPGPGKKFTIEHIEVQMSKNTVYTPYRVEAWAGDLSGLGAAYEPFSQAMYDAGYGVDQSKYRGIRDMLNVCNRGYTLPPTNELSDDTLVYPFYYTRAKELRGDWGVLLAISIDNDTEFANCELGTITFYIEKSDV